MFSAADERFPETTPRNPGRSVDGGGPDNLGGEPQPRLSTGHRLWLAVISEGDLFAIVIGPSSLVVDGDVTYTSRQSVRPARGRRLQRGNGR